MTRIAAITVAAATLVAALPAFAADGPQTSPVKLQRVVMQCDTDQATRRGFMRQHGVAPTFITADQALAARAAGETWAAPRCMTAREHARLSQVLTSYAAVR
ncbi:hypothetical protein [Brevundimonas variabilis]|uniref:Uncharacterized protein n=1 Tax=Brevundimonas variabilis TaxID=74312 RepID=A0A7W9CGC3_9CAUL|nr:hypothetical protein [Brevundimonas variabilis]MBB5745054.1 hypothetical protein [Brevundimonas variabilis]